MEAERRCSSISRETRSSSRRRSGAQRGKRDVIVRVRSEPHARRLISAAIGQVRKPSVPMLEVFTKNVALIANSESNRKAI